jgi:hypothetical protein
MEDRTRRGSLGLRGAAAIATAVRAAAIGGFVIGALSIRRLRPLLRAGPPPDEGRSRLDEVADKDVRSIPKFRTLLSMAPALQRRGDGPVNLSGDINVARDGAPDISVPLADPLDRRRDNSRGKSRLLSDAWLA